MSAAVSLVLIVACLLLIGGLASVLRAVLQRHFSATSSAPLQDPQPRDRSKGHRYGIATVMPSRAAAVSAGGAKRRLPG
jgi:hypothetical protein